MKKLWRWLCRRACPPPPQVIGVGKMIALVPYWMADKLIKEDPAWKIAPWEDHNQIAGFVWLEKDYE